MANSPPLRIVLVRHGLAGKADPEKFPDDDLRPLTNKGKLAFAEAADGLRSLDLSPARICTSPALRTRQTAEILARALGLGPGSIKLLPALHHEAPPKAAFPKLARLAGAGRWKATVLVLVGHEPWLGEFLSLLVAGRPGARFRMAKGGACLVHADAIAPGGGSLAWFLTQDHLRDLSRS